MLSAGICGASPSRRVALRIQSVVVRRPEATVMLQTLLEAASVEAESNSRDVTNVSRASRRSLVLLHHQALIGQLVRAHPELVIPLNVTDTTQ